MRSKQLQVKLICLYDPKSTVAEAYRTLRTNIQFAGVDRQIKTLMVTSAGPGEGKTTTVTNLAIAMAQSGKKVILVDGDLRKPTIHNTFYISNRLGLTNLLTGQAEFVKVVHRIPELPLDVIPAGSIPPNPADFLGSQPMQRLIASLREEYEMVLVDTPPILPVTDGQLLASYIDGVLLVLGCNKVQIDHARKAIALLKHVGANVIGSVLNNKKEKGRNSYHYRYYAED
ncbi:CpsD/CapB family tyrosine-protein kinase [Effusibacillus lacus]|uniref:CpsD/CapB family tyrosine-protein kinase n=1 Tax=Effusibacillus lacus TaxID=1348429 RepID=UPI000BB96829|nr:CpsD/CapB family tyrosine-protein kinase [Effusibacillus lacus]TCS70821.1 capsular exopolysaccharide synthesis family protein [Effusibacillus lacus]